MSYARHRKIPIPGGIVSTIPTYLDDLEAAQAHARRLAEIQPDFPAARAAMLAEKTTNQALEAGKLFKRQTNRGSSMARHEIFDGNGEIYFTGDVHEVSGWLEAGGPEWARESS